MLCSELLVPHCRWDIHHGHGVEDAAWISRGESPTSRCVSLEIRSGYRLSLCLVPVCHDVEPNDWNAGEIVEDLSFGVDVSILRLVQV